MHNLMVIVTLSSEGSCTSAIKYHQRFFNCRLNVTRICISFVDCFFLSSHLTAAIEIGFTQRRIFHTEVVFGQFEVLINKSRVSEQTFIVQVELSTLNSPFGQSATQGEDFQISSFGATVSFLQLDPSQPNRLFSYLIIGDNTPENQEVFQLSVTPDIYSPTFTCTEANGCFQQLEIVIVNDDGEFNSGVAKLGHTGARALATGGCAPPCTSEGALPENCWCRMYRHQSRIGR